MNNATVQILSVTSRQTKTGNPYQNGDALVNGQQMGFVIWEHPQAPQLQAGTTFTVDLDGKAAKTDVRDGQTRLSIQKDAPIQIVTISAAAPAIPAQPAIAPQPAAAAPAPAPAPQTPQLPQVAPPAPSGVSAEQTMQRDADLTKVFYDRLLAHGFTPDQATMIAAHHVPGEIFPLCWFGRDPQKQL